MLAILLNVVLLQLFGYAIIGEYSLPCFLYHSTKYTMQGIIVYEYAFKLIVSITLKKFYVRSSTNSICVNFQVIAAQRRRRIQKDSP